MESAEFAAAAGGLVDSARRAQLALMCAEQHPSQCHRRLVSDWLAAQDIEVLHLLEDGRTEPHTLTWGAVIAAGKVGYPGPGRLGTPGMDSNPLSGSGSPGSR
jgi:hypothetical protein